MSFSVLYWNIWLENQIRGRENAAQFISELHDILTTYQPDVVGLNELLRHSQSTDPYILDELTKLGYVFQHFAPASPYTTDWEIGAGIASRIAFKNLEEVDLGYDTRADRRGFPDNTIKAISCSITTEEQDIHIIVSHLICLRGHTLKDHYEQSRALKNYIVAHAPQNTIIGGDFNEPRGMPRSFFASTRSLLHHRTGTISNPTWSHNAYKITPIRANLDRIFWTKAGDLRLEDFTVIPVKTSDHKPLYARFRVTSQ